MIYFFHVNLDTLMFAKLKYIVTIFTALFLTFSGISVAQEPTTAAPADFQPYEGTLTTDNPSDPLNILIEQENANRLQKRLEEERMKAYERQLEREAKKEIENKETSTDNLISETSDQKPNNIPPK